MAIIYSYPELLSLEDRDLLLISDLSSKKKPTMRVELGTLAAYINSTAPGGNDLHFTYNQVFPSSQWTVQHDLGKFPSVSVADSAGSIVMGQVEYIDENSLILTFVSAFAGVAYLN
jgi:hypothetical protein